MKAILIVGHGGLPEAMKQSVQMIAGTNESLFTVCLEPDDGKESLEKKLDLVNGNLKGYDSVLVFADLMGGSPANAVLSKYLDSENVTLISGMNLPMVLTAVLSDVSTNELLREGKIGIKDIKAELNKPVIENQNVSDSQKVSEGEPYQIKNIRIDSRGIHGQVATAWVPQLKVDRIIVIDELAVKDEIQKTALKMAKPNNTKLSILSPKKAVERLTEAGAYLDESLMIVLLKIDTLKQLDHLGYRFKEVNIGNVPNRPGTIACRKTVYLLNEEIDALKDLNQKGTHFTAQAVPNDSETDFDKYLYEMNKEE